MSTSVERPTMTVAELFAIMWTTVAEMIGTAATATVLRRSAKRAAARGAQLDGVDFERHGFEFSYALPPSWRGASATHGDAVEALRALAHELRSVLRELTGPVLVRRLEANAELSRAKLFHPLEAT